MAVSPSKKILFIGFSCVDFINVVDKFPVEDTDQLILKSYWQRGGNATNSCTVASLLSMPCEYFGSLPTSGQEARWLIDDFQAMGICTDHCVMKPVQCPVSSSILNVTNGSRTILQHLRDYVYVKFDDFRQKFGEDLDAFSWIHFELIPNSEDILAMMEHVKRCNKKCAERGALPVIMSVEIEQPSCTNTESIMKLADFVFVSKDFAQFQGHKDGVEAVTNLYRLCQKGATLICAWGDKGATIHRNGTTFTAPARTDITVVDTLGAGDTFNAGFICYAFKTNRFRDLTDDDLKSAVTFACQLAGYKCSIFGYSELKGFPLVVKD